MLLFLDFDGVLHPEPCYRSDQLFCRLPIFESVMKGFPEVEIVISSTWRETDDIEQLRSYLPASLSRRIVGVTPVWRSLSDAIDLGYMYPRQIEIEAWLRAANRAWEPWIALDDRPYWFRPFLKNLVVCKPNVGLDEDAALRLADRFRSLNR